MDGGRIARMYCRLKGVGNWGGVQALLERKEPSPSEIGRAGLHGSAETGTTRGAMRSGSDQGHENIRLGGHTSHTMGNVILRLVERTFSCR